MRSTLASFAPLRPSVGSLRGGVGVVADQFDVLAAPPVGELERAGADRGFPGSVRTDRIGMRDAGAVAVAARQHAEERAARLGKPEHDLRGCRCLDCDDLDLPGAVEVGATRPAGFRIEEALPAPHDLGRRQRRAIVECHAVAQGEGVGAPVSGCGDLLRQHRSDRAVGTPGDQTFIDVLKDQAGIVVGADARHQPANVRGDHGAQGVFGVNGGRGGERQQARNNETLHHLLHLTQVRAALPAWQNPALALPPAAPWCNRAVGDRRCRRAIPARRSCHLASPPRGRRPARRRRDRG